MKRLLIFMLLICSASVVHATTVMDAANDGAGYLIAVQKAGTGDPTQDGGWGWTNGDTSASNIAGATGLSLVRMYNATGTARYLDAAKAAGDFISNTTYDNGEVRYATADPYYDWQLSLAAGDNTWSNNAKTEFFDTLHNGTYGPSDYTTAGWIGAVQTGRSGGYVNLRPWEFSTIAVTAANIGNTGQETLFVDAILDGLDTLDSSQWWDILGATGGLRGLALDGITSFDPITSPAHAGINGISSVAGLADYIAGLQNADGSWYWSSDINSPGESDKDTQTSAYAILALEAAGDVLGTLDYADEIAAGRAWLVTMQDSITKGFWGYPGEWESTPYINNEVSGEAVAALVPEPTTLLLLGMGMVGLLKRRS